MVCGDSPEDGRSEQRVQQTQAGHSMGCLESEDWAGALLRSTGLSRGRGPPNSGRRMLSMLNLSECVCGNVTGGGLSQPTLNTSSSASSCLPQSLASHDVLAVSESDAVVVHRQPIFILARSPPNCAALEIIALQSTPPNNNSPSSSNHSIHCSLFRNDLRSTMKLMSRFSFSNVYTVLSLLAFGVKQ